MRSSAPEPSHDYLAKIAQPKLSANLVQLLSLAVMQIEGISLCDVLNVSTDYVVLLVVAPENVYRCSVSNKFFNIRITVKRQSIKESQPTSRPLFSKNRPETAMLNAFVLG